MRPAIKKLFIFWQTGHIQNLSHGHKMEPRSATARCMLILGDMHIIVKLQDVCVKRIRCVDFHIVRSRYDPTAPKAHLSIPMQIKSAPTKIIVATMVKETVGNYRRTRMHIFGKLRTKKPWRKWKQKKPYYGFREGVRPSEILSP